MSKKKGYRKKKILIVEDDSASSFPLQYYLRQNGFTAEIAEDADTAIEIFETTVPMYSVLIIDIELRDNSGVSTKDATGGIKVIRKVLEHDPGFQTRIIVHSSKIDKNDERWQILLQCGLPEERIKLKPTAADTILDIIKEIIKANKK